MKDIQRRTVLGQAFYEGKGASFTLPAGKWTNLTTSLLTMFFFRPTLCYLLYFAVFDRLYNAACCWNKLHRVEPKTAFYCDPREENRSVKGSLWTSPHGVTQQLLIKRNNSLLKVKAAVLLKHFQSTIFDYTISVSIFWFSLIYIHMLHSTIKRMMQSCLLKDNFGGKFLLNYPRT